MTSALEATFSLQLQALGAPGAHREYQFAQDMGRQCIIDFAWPTVVYLGHENMQCLWSRKVTGRVRSASRIEGWTSQSVQGVLRANRAETEIDRRRRDEGEAERTLSCEPCTGNRTCAPVGSRKSRKTAGNRAGLCSSQYRQDQGISEGTSREVPRRTSSETSHSQGAQVGQRGVHYARAVVGNNGRRRWAMPLLWQRDTIDYGPFHTAYVRWADAPRQFSSVLWAVQQPEVRS